MTIRNSRGQTSYQRYMDRGREGDPGVAGVETRDMVNPILPQLGTVTIGGTASDGDYITTIVDDTTGESHVVTTTRSTTPASNSDLATQHASDVNDLAGLNNVVDAVAVAAVVTLTFQHAGRSYTITTAETTATGTIVWAETQAAGGSARAVARFVRRNGVSAGLAIVADLAAGSLAVDVAGIILIRHGQPVNLEGSLDSDADQEPAGTVVPVAYNKSVRMKKVDSGSVNPGDQVYAVRLVTGGDALGQVRGTADGVQHVIEAAPTAGNAEVNTITVQMIDESSGLTVFQAPFTMVTDGSGTDAEVTDALLALIDASELVTVLGASTANVSDDLEITAPLGFRLVVQSIGVGTIAVADVTAFAMYTIKLDKSKAEFGELITENGLGEVWLKNI